MFVSVIFYISRLVPNILTEQTLSYLAIFPGGTVLLPPCRPHRMFVGDVPRRPQCHLPVGNSSKPYLVEGAWGSNLRDNPRSLCKGATVEHGAADVETSPKGPRSCPGTPSVDSVLALRACEHLVVGPPIRFRPSVITDGALTPSVDSSLALQIYQHSVDLSHYSWSLYPLCQSLALRISVNTLSISVITDGALTPLSVHPWPFGSVDTLLSDIQSDLSHH